jgi:CheY-like chemotaxis protein
MFVRLMSLQRLSNLTIVVVEDDNDTRRYLTLFLDSSGANVVPAGNAWDALEAIKTYQPDIVVSDIMMPGRTSAVSADSISLSENPIASRNLAFHATNERRSKSTIALGSANSFKTAQHSCKFCVEKLIPN